MMRVETEHKVQGGGQKLNLFPLHETTSNDVVLGGISKTRIPLTQEEPTCILKIDFKTVLQHLL